MQAIEKASLLIDRLISPSKTAWLIYPKDIHLDLEKEMFELRQSREYT